jgi:hypothetical protein
LSVIRATRRGPRGPARHARVDPRLLAPDDEGWLALRAADGKAYCFNGDPASTRRAKRGQPSSVASALTVSVTASSSKTTVSLPCLVRLAAPAEPQRKKDGQLWLLGVYNRGRNMAILGSTRDGYLHLLKQQKLHLACAVHTGEAPPLVRTAAAHVRDCVLRAGPRSGSQVLNLNDPFSKKKAPKKSKATTPPPAFSDTSSSSESEPTPPPKKHKRSTKRRPDDDDAGSGNGSRGGTPAPCRTGSLAPSAPPSATSHVTGHAAANAAATRELQIRNGEPVHIMYDFMFLYNRY